MGHSGSRGAICCALRDKDGLIDASSGNAAKAPQFSYVEAETPLPEETAFMTYAPMHQREVDEVRRLAIATPSEVRVYKLSEQGLGQAPEMTLTHCWRVSSGEQIDYMLFAEEELSRNLAVAIGPSDDEKAGAEYAVKVFTCQPQPAGSPTSSSARRREPPPQEPMSAAGIVDWTTKGPTSILRGHKAQIVKIVVNRPYMLSMDVEGECILWQKNGWQKTNAFERRATAMVHKSGASDLILDRQFLYTAGRSGDCIRVWLLPELCQVLEIPLDLSEDFLVSRGASGALLGALPGWDGAGAGAASFCAPGLQKATPQVTPRCNRSAPVSPINSPRRLQGQELAPADASPSPVATQQSALLHLKVNMLRRPISRWAGSSGIGRGSQLFPKTPRGCLFVGAVLREDCEFTHAGTGILMEWNLGDKPALQTARVAHDSPIVALVYGPYDNGPVITADASGLFRVWEFSLAAGLCLAQQVDLPVFPSAFTLDSGTPSSASLRPPPGAPLMAVEPPRALYVAAAGRLFVWERSKASPDFLGEACAGSRSSRAC